MHYEKCGTFLCATETETFTSQVSKNPVLKLFYISMLSSHCFIEAKTLTNKKNKVFAKLSVLDASYLLSLDNVFVMTWVAGVFEERTRKQKTRGRVMKFNKKRAFYSGY